MHLSSLPRETSILIILAFDVQHLRNKNTLQVGNIKGALENFLFQADICDIEGARWHIPSKSNFKNWTKHTLIDLILAAVQGAALPQGTYAVPQLRATESTSWLISYLYPTAL